MTSPNVTSDYCANPNYFSSVLAPAVEKRLPAPGSYAAAALNHISNIGPFIQTVSNDLCDDGRIGLESTKSMAGFVTRSATSAVVIGGTASLAAAGLVIGSPFVAIGAGLASLAILPPLAERATFGIARFAGELLEGFNED